VWRRHARLIAVVAGVVAASAVAMVISFGGRAKASANEDAPELPDGPSSISEPLHKDKRVVSDAERRELLSRAQLWRAPSVPISRASFAHLNLDELSCKLKVSEVGGTTPKFDCELDTGEEIRIKYGIGREVPAEAATTRLLRTLGFGADDVTLVKRLRCYGCPVEPFSILKAVEATKAEPLYERVVNYNNPEDFEWVGYERKLNARPIQTDRLEGWAFFELDGVDSAKGGAPRAHVDAVRLMAILLAHWDNKSENQRLVCLDRDWPKDAKCAKPFLMLQDVGATFGPRKMDLEAWEATPIWADRVACRVSMQDLPHGGATFATTVISESGRRFLAGLLAQLSDRQLSELFASARFDQKRGPMSAAAPVAEWVRVFKAKVAAISDGPSCPAA
jgi:hypothetical protein